MILPVVVDVIVPVFGVVALGYLVGAFRWLDSGAVRGLSLYVFNIAIPLLLFKAMSTVTLPVQMPWHYVLGFFACALGSFMSVFWLMRRVSAQSTGEVGVFAFGCSYGNFIPLGIPLVMTAFGEAATVPLFLLVAFQAPIFFAPMIVIQESAKQRERRGPIGWPVLKSIVANQYLLGIGLGVAVNLSGLSPPGPISEIIALIGQSAAPCAQFLRDRGRAQPRSRSGRGQEPAAAFVGVVGLGPVGFAAGLAGSHGGDGGASRGDQHLPFRGAL